MMKRVAASTLLAMLLIAPPHARAQTAFDPTVPPQSDEPLSAQPVPPPQPSVPQGPAAPDPTAWVPLRVADLHMLNKVDATTTPVSLAVGQSVAFSTLSITLRACVVRPPDQPADAAAFLVITDQRPGAPGFTGWVFAHEPSASMLEDPILNLLLVGCHA